MMMRRRKPVFFTPQHAMKQRSDTVQTDATFEEMMAMESSERENSSSLLTTLLPTALQIHLLSYLSEPDLYRVGQVNRHLACLVLVLEDDKEQDNDNGGDFLWQGLLQQRWPCLKTQPQPTTTSHHHHQKLNNRLLLKLAADTAPTTVNPNRLVNQLSVVDDNNNNDNPNKAIRFTGRIGTGDRSFRANQPLPRPNNFRHQNKAPTTAHHHKTTTTGKRGWWTRVVSSWRQRRRRHASKNTLQPFVVPFRQDDGHVMTPRLIAYFEVSILPEPSTSSSSQQNGNHAGHTKRECVAVGLSTYRFELHRRLPGWDAFSFAYHGDDGLVFHHQSAGVKYGPTFGAGSTVGCGLDYASGRIFYTLNGTFLGYAPTLLDDRELSLDWFPTVGLDSHAAVQCNFGMGDTPFCFDLATMVHQQNQTLTSHP
mmetsp:Transcript_9589/g.19328  ORF Transcript_9589/g.19328 Transcript_9589/m.19328 type:complete len:424 (+) Transcript_9589:190-1461(+)